MSDNKSKNVSKIFLDLFFIFILGYEVKVLYLH